MSNVKCKMKNEKGSLSFLRKQESRSGFQVKLGMTLLFVVSCLLLVVSYPAFSETIVASDPMYIGVGARPLGMGKAYVAVAEDGDTLFINPAGLGKAGTPKLVSMYSNLIGDVGYMVLGGVYPQTANSAIGAGAIISSVSGIDLRDAAQVSTGTANWGSSVFFLSYGVNIEDAKLQLGGSVKYYSQGGTGQSQIETASATGMGFDVGAIYSVNDQFSLGVSAQNPISTKLSSGNNIDNTVPSLIKVGGAFKSRLNDNQKVTLAADADLASKYSLAHVGAEFQVTPNVSLRAGIDQNPVGSAIESNPTAGIGLRANGLEFNYAYHPYGGITENATHYFSVSYVGIPTQAMEEASLSIALRSPTDKSVIYSDSVRVEGNVVGSQMVSINGMSFPAAKDGSFAATIPISKVGKKLILVEASNIKGKTAQASSRVLRMVNFADVPDGHWAKNPIEGSSTVGLIQGYPDGTFKPSRVLTRAELAVLLVRAKGIEVSERPSKVFKDVNGEHWAAPYIKEALDMGLVKGYPDGKFRPNNRISKAETIAVLVRYDGLQTAQVQSKPFADVAVKSWAAPYIQAAKDNGMLSYIEGNTLGAKKDVSRAETVELMSKTSVAGRLIKDLLSWEKGFEFVPVLKASIN